MSRIILALSGWRGSGKDTCADLLVNEFGFTKLSFAARLKDMVAQQYNIPRDYLDDVAMKEAPLGSYPAIPGDRFAESIHQLLHTELRSGYWTPRALCILEGSAKRSVHSNYWVQSVATQILTDTADTNFVISDLRYRTEADTLKALIPGLRVIRINRYATIETTDPSERDLDTYKFDYVLSNNKSVEEFHNTICNIPELALDDIISMYKGE